MLSSVLEHPLDLKGSWPSLRKPGQVESKVWSGLLNGLYEGRRESSRVQEAAYGGD